VALSRRQFIKLSAAVAAVAALPAVDLYERGERFTHITDLRRSYLRSGGGTSLVAADVGHRAFLEYRDQLRPTDWWQCTSEPREHLLFKGIPMRLSESVHPDEFVWRRA